MKKIHIKFWTKSHINADTLKGLKYKKPLNSFCIHITIGFIAVVLGFMFINKFSIGRIVFAFIFFHEMSHLLAFLILGANINEIIFNPFGITMIYPFNMCQSYWKDIVCYLSAPVLNLMIAYFFKTNFPPTFYVRIIIAVNFLIGIFNLLPIGDLDGGQVVKSILLLKFSPYIAELVSFILSIICLIPLTLGSLIIFYRTKNPTAVITCIFLIFKIFSSEGDNK